MVASVKDVAERAGVSVGTVSNVLNRPSKVAPSTVRRVRKAIEELGFVRNDAARQLRAGRSKSIGLVVLDVRNPFFTDVARGAEARAAEEGYIVLLANSDEDVEREQRYLEQFEEQRVGGILLSPVGEDLAALNELRARNLPLVIVDRDAVHAGFSSVTVDDVAGGALAAQHLYDTGRRRIAFIGGPDSLRQVRDRLQGVQSVVESHADVQLEIITTRALSVSEGRRVGHELSERDISQRPDALVAANDLIAIGALQGIVARGRAAVPEEIAITGYDDIEFAEAAVVPLTSIRQPAEQIGYTAMDLLLEESGARPGSSACKRVSFQPELVVRDSTRATTP